MRSTDPNAQQLLDAAVRLDTPGRRPAVRATAREIIDGLTRARAPEVPVRLRFVHMPEEREIVTPVYRWVTFTYSLVRVGDLASGEEVADGPIADFSDGMWYYAGHAWTDVNIEPVTDGGGA